MPFWLLIVLAVVLLATGGYLSLIASRPAREWRLAPLLYHDYAHRGLFLKDQTVPENSLLAFERAIEHGYGIELDVQLSSDGQVVVFHDDDLARLCGDKRQVVDVPYAELKELYLAGSEETIPLFSEVLSLTGGQVPLIVELKPGRCNAELCEKTYTLLKEYPGAVCVESFDPRIVRWFKRNAKKVVRGQLASAQPSDKTSKLLQFAGRNLLGNFLAKPHFIAYRHQDAATCFNLKACKRWFHLLTVAWTVQEEDDLAAIRRHFDLIIFEGFHPST